MRSRASRPPTRPASPGCIPARARWCPARTLTWRSTTSRRSGRWTPARSSSRRTRGRRSTGGACGRGSCVRWCAARRCTPTARSWPSRGLAASCPARRITPWAGSGRRRRADVFRLALINPNTDEHHTEAMGGVARAALPEGCDVTAVNPNRGPTSIESAADSVVAAAEVAALVQALPDYDAYLIACFGDPGLEAAYIAASLVAKRFGVITTLPRSIPALEEGIDALGLRSRCAGIVPLNIPVAEQGSGHPDTTSAIVALGKRLAVDHGADALILACGGMADVAQAVEDEVGVPVCDGVSFGAGLAHSRWRSGLRTSKAAAYAAPEPIPYVGMQG